MSTDLKLHNIYMEKLIQKTPTLLNLNFVLKLADLSHFFRNFKIHCYWVYKLKNEHKQSMNSAELSRDTIWFKNNFTDDIYGLLCKKYPRLNLLEEEYDKNTLIWKSLGVEK